MVVTIRKSLGKSDSSERIIKYRLGLVTDHPQPCFWSQLGKAIAEKNADAVHSLSVNYSKGLI